MDITFFRCFASAVAISVASMSSLAADQAPTAARSVHLFYTAPAADWFYNEVVIEETTPGSYFMVCGFQQGYFGLQELSNGKKVALFSVWDPTNKNDPNAVAPELRVISPFEGENVRINRFGGEGTGGKSMYDFDWKIGQSYRFAVHTFKIDQRVAYAGFLFEPETKQWKHLVTFATPPGFGEAKLSGLYSFVEDFRRDTKSMMESRRATFGNQWVRTLDGKWVPALQASFSASRSEKEAKDTIDAGEKGGLFYLQTGGTTQATRKVGSAIKRPPSGDQAPVVPTDDQARESKQ